MLDTISIVLTLINIHSSFERTTAYSISPSLIIQEHVEKSIKVDRSYNLELQKKVNFIDYKKMSIWNFSRSTKCLWTIFIFDRTVGTHLFQKILLKLFTHTKLIYNELKLKSSWNPLKIKLTLSGFSRWCELDDRLFCKLHFELVVKLTGIPIRWKKFYSIDIFYKIFDR